jgi:hypothetical protein
MLIGLSFVRSQGGFRERQALNASFRREEERVAPERRPLEVQPPGEGGARLAVAEMREQPGRVGGGELAVELEGDAALRLVAGEGEPSRLDEVERHTT